MLGKELLKGEGFCVYVRMRFVFVFISYRGKIYNLRENGFSNLKFCFCNGE